jgi:eukaryotic-like serine/threonine-protein kinase
VSGPVFGPYRLVALIGRGGMAEVWRAVDTRKDREVALKLLGPWLRGDDAFQRRFRRESALVARLNAPNVIPIHDHGEIEGRLFIDMPLVEGTDLGTLLGRDGPLPPARAVRIVEQVAHGLSAAHRAGLVHRDVKPSNVLITGDGSEHVYLIDFGVARALDGTVLSSSIGAVIGSPNYLAPERFEGDGDHRSDIYALGCLLHEALTGEPAFTADSIVGLLHVHQHAPPPRPSQHPGVPPAMDAVVARALAKDPDHRFPTAADLAVAARAALTGAAAPAPPDDSTAPTTRIATPAPADRPSRLQRIGVWVGAVTVVAAGVALAVYVSDDVSSSAGAPHTATAAPSPAAAHPAEQALTGHTSDVLAVTSTRVDGRTVLVSGSEDSTVRLWDAGTGAPVGEPLTYHTDAVGALVGGELAGQPVVVSGSDDGRVRVRDAATGARISGGLVTSTLGFFRALALGDLDGRPVIACGGGFGGVELVDAITAETVVGPFEAHSAEVRGLALTRVGDRTVVVSVSLDGAVSIWDAATGTPIGTRMTDHEGGVVALAVTEVDGRPVAVTGGADRTVRRWDLTTGTPIGTPLTGHTGEVSAVATTSVDGRQVIVSASADGTLRLWDLTTGAPIGDPLAGHGGPVLAVTTTEAEDGPIAVSGGADATVHTWDLRARMAGGATPR